MNIFQNAACEAINYNTKGTCTLKTRLAASSDKIDETWTYCPAGKTEQVGRRGKE